MKKKKITGGGNCNSHNEEEKITGGGNCNSHNEEEKITGGGNCNTVITKKKKLWEDIILMTFITQH